MGKKIVGNKKKTTIYVYIYIYIREQRNGGKCEELNHQPSA